MPLKRLLAILAIAAVAGCSPGSKSASGPISVVTSFSTLNSFVTAVGGSRVSVQNLVPVGASPEDYQPTPQDIATLSGARLFVENGAGIETWLQRTVTNVRNPELQTLTLSDGLPIVNHNPHLWMDPQLAKRYVDKVRDALTKLDPPHAAEYAKNAAAYKMQLDALERGIAAKIATIPSSQRSMIIFHNAFDYYNRRFGIRTVGVVEQSPGQEANPQYVSHLVELARENHVRAVFAEPEYSPKLIQALAKSAGITTVENLYDDSIGNDPRVADYIHMLQHDTDVIVGALR